MRILNIREVNKFCHAFEYMTTKCKEPNPRPVPNGKRRGMRDHCDPEDCATNENAMMTLCSNSPLFSLVTWHECRSLIDYYALRYK